MSYIRGEYYTWASDLSDGSEVIVLPEQMPMELFDELVVMRFAELGRQEREEAEARAIEHWTGNVGCEALLERHNLPSPFEKMHKELTKDKQQDG